MFRIGGNTSYDRKIKIPMKIPEFKRFGIELIAEFCGIPNGFPNQGGRLVPLPPPWTHRSVHSPSLHHGGDTAKSVCSLSRGRVPDS